MAAGELRERVTFQERATVSEGYGNEQGDWIDRFTCAARIQPLRGSEPVLAARLSGVQPVVIRVRTAAAMSGVTTDWRLVNARTGTPYNIRTVTPAERRDYIDLLCEAGVAS